jgi:uncharacterized protein YkwD
MPVLVAPCLLIAVLAGPSALARPAAPSSVSAGGVMASDPGIEAQFVNSINSLRASKGLNQLQVSGDLVGMARRWTDRMVAAGQISHNPNLGTEIGGAWTKMGENVGVGYDVPGLMQAFINSPAHYANLVDPAWTHVGVGVTMASDGRMYTTHNFMALGGGAPPAASPTPPPTAPPATAPPAPTTTTTTAPPPPPPPQPHPTPERVTAVLDPLRSLEAG